VRTPAHTQEQETCPENGQADQEENDGELEELSTRAGEKRADGQGNRWRQGDLASVLTGGAGGGAGERTDEDDDTESTIETSSMTTRSVARGLVALCRKPLPFGSNSSRRCMVLASSPVASLRPLAAQPVGAHSSTRRRLARSAWRMLVTIVVLPTPGPPVITVTLPVSTCATAVRCEAARVRLYGVPPRE
jgi:hypothetical protein